MKNPNNSSSALKVVRPADPKASSQKVKVFKQKGTKAKKSDTQIARINLRKKAGVLRTAAYLLEMIGLVGEVILLAAANLLNVYLTTFLDVPPVTATATSVTLAVVGLIFGIVCIVFSLCLSGTAESMKADIKHLPKND